MYNLFKQQKVLPWISYILLRHWGWWHFWWSRFVCEGPLPCIFWQRALGTSSTRDNVKFGHCSYESDLHKELHLAWSLSWCLDSWRQPYVVDTPLSLGSIVWGPGLFYWRCPSWDLSSATFVWIICTTCCNHFPAEGWHNSYPQRQCNKEV